MIEIVSAGRKEFFSALAVAVVLYLATEYIRYMFTSYKVAALLIQITVFAVFAYLVLTRYASVFIYDIDDSSLRVSRKIGHRRKDLEIKFSDMTSLSYKISGRTKTYTMKKGILPHKKDIYLSFVRDGKDYALHFSPSAAMLGTLRKLIGKGK